MKAREALSHIEKQGWVVATIRGSHHKLRHPDHGWQIFAHRPQDEIPASELPQLDKRFSLNPSLTNHAEEVQAVRRQQERPKPDEHQHRLPRGFPFDRKRFANALQVGRLSNGLSVIQLAENLHLDEAAIRHYERERHQPSLENLYAIKDYFGWSDFYGAPVRETSLSSPTDEPLHPEPPVDTPTRSMADVPARTEPMDRLLQATPPDRPIRAMPTSQSSSPHAPDKPPLAIPTLAEARAIVVAELDKLLFQVSNLEGEARTLRQENERLRERLAQVRKFFEENSD